MGSIDPELIDRIARFLDHYGDTPQPVCMECLTEFAEGIRRCSDCGSPLVAGPRAIDELRTLLEKGRVQQAAAARAAARAAVPPAVPIRAPDPFPEPLGDEDEVAEGTSCPRCGTLFDPDVDVEGCETCRQNMLHEAEATEDVEPDPAELAQVTKLRRFLDTPHDPSQHYCPGCFDEFRSDATACLKCTKELLTLDETRAYATRSLSDLTGSWFAPLMDDANAPFAETLLAALEESPDAPPIELRARREVRDFSPIFAVWRSYRSTYYVRQNQLAPLRAWLVAQDLGKAHAEALQNLIEHVDGLLRPEQVDS